MPLIKTEYVLFTLDDYFLTERISTQAVNEDIQIMEKHQIDYLRLFVMTMKSLRNRKAEELEPDIFLLAIMQVTTLSVCMQASGVRILWKKR